MRIWFLAVLLSGCAYDFEDYLPRATDASIDTRVDTGTAVQDTAPVDVGCMPSNGAMCYASAKTCGDTCDATLATCEAACTNPNCRKDCRDAEIACSNKCISDCNTCTTTGGCLTAARCATEVG
jgi:hypothetical protein